MPRCAPPTSSKVLAIFKSLRAASYNEALPRAARQLQPCTLDIGIHEGPREIGLYD
ncbi:hypothetical protein J3486_08750 [Streptomyces sp. VRA16 Mangrove soil]|nr:hypothetical protein [Streptomyces sp. VRA16 Mangrove soil]